MSRSRPARSRGQGAAAARQMGLLLDLSPDGEDDPEGNDMELQAELLALVGDGGTAKKLKGKAPLPMEDIEHMAALCMKDLDEEEEDDGDLESDADLMAELNEVLEEEEEAEPPACTAPAPRISPGTPTAPGGLESRLSARIDMYQTAISSAKAAGESSRARRCERGLKTLQSMLASVRKGKPINEDEIPPPVATGNHPAPSEPPTSADRTHRLDEPIREQDQQQSQEAPVPCSKRSAPPTLPKPSLLPPPQRSLATTPETPLISPLTPSQPEGPEHTGVKAVLLSRQREYKLAALQAKQSGDTELAKRHYGIAKKFDPILEAVDRGEPVTLGSIPPPPGDAVIDSPAPPTQPPAPAPPAAPPVADTAPPAPRNVGEALQQRLERYRVAAETAKSKGDERKARMHQRIVKQYQDAIKAHKAGRPVNLSELPVPPGCPPVQGSEGSGGDQSIMGVLETAMKLANQDADAEEEEGPGEKVMKPEVQPVAKRQAGSAPSRPSLQATREGGADTPKPKLGAKAQQQLDFLQTRRQQFLRAALRSKQQKDLQGAALQLRHAKGLDPMINAAKSGLPVDITKVPPAPVSVDDYTLVQSRSAPVSARSAEQYAQLMDRLRQQHKKCLSYSEQFTHLGNVTETSRFEKMAEECMKSIDVLKQALQHGCPVPKHHTEERTFNIIKIFPELNSNELLLTIVKGINLPAPTGLSNELDSSVRFEFPFPSLEEAQRDRTHTVKNTNCPEFGENFKLNINRGHRAFKRVVQSKGIKLEVVHKGGLFKNDKVVGTVQLKLEALESKCEIRELLEVLDGRKSTGGHLEVRVRIREPLGGQQLETVTEKWLVIDPVPLPSVSISKSRPPGDPVKDSRPPGDPVKNSRPRGDPVKNSRPPGDPVKNSRPPGDPVKNSRPRESSASHSASYKLHSLNLLKYDKDRLEKKIAECRHSRRDPPTDLLSQYQDVCQRIQWQRGLLEHPSPTLQRDYEAVLNHFRKRLEESIKQYSTEGNRESAKEALGRLRLVESEIEYLGKRRPV
ncbi:coiled-coil and C2 domain-containing protein 1A [Lepisosteus oculatus]|uniref:coiled-coil and C2 domain-containing protein 1A n=1 Tax=Lepisosteus oculatus TaxID=7918 RepID=UPI0035F52D10